MRSNQSIVREHSPAPLAGEAARDLALALFSLFFLSVFFPALIFVVLGRVGHAS
jgi:hypothetical protein